MLRSRLHSHSYRHAPILLDTKFLHLRVKHELFTSDQRNVQETPVTFEPFPRNALNKRMALEQSGPNCWESISERTNSVHWRARSLALSLDISVLPFDQKIKNRSLNAISKADANIFLLRSNAPVLRSGSIGMAALASACVVYYF